MGNEADKKYTWVIKNFPYFGTKILYSDDFEIGGCKWRLIAYPSGEKKWNAKYMSLYIDVADAKHLPSGWRRHARIDLTVVNQLSPIRSVHKVKSKWFDQKTPATGFVTMIHCYDIRDESRGFRVNGEVKIVVKVEVSKVVGRADVVLVGSEEDSGEGSEEGSVEESEQESEEANQPEKKAKVNDDGAVSSDFHKETMDVNGFQVLPSQVKFVKRVFMKYPDIALEFLAKSQYLRTACMNVLLSLIDTLCQSPQILSNEDLVEADNGLAYVKDSGFKVDWLEKRLEEVKQKKKEEQIGETRTRELEKELQDLKQKCSSVEALLEKEKAKVLAARAHLTLDDFV